MGIIKVLDENLINKIAAGEVIERPASVVKEFVENSIDASANKITVELKEGGVSFIKISDNGTGMDPEDAKISWERHATSKIKNDEDLFSINTLGFRGEALASVAAVSKMCITTKTSDTNEGIKINIEGGKFISDKIIGCPTGTTIEVNDLFFNTPARKKYLKSFSTELSHVIDVITKYALLHPEIHFTIIHNNKRVLLSPSCDMKSNIANILGLDTAKQMIPIKYSDDYVSIQGYISKPTLTRSDKSNQSIFVNGRFVKNKIITDTIYEAYQNLLTVGRHPIVVLHIKMDPSKIDVNVHPTKIEIRLQSEESIRKSVFEAIRNSLLDSGLIVDLSEESMPMQKMFPEKRQLKLDGTIGHAKTHNPKTNSPSFGTSSNHRKYSINQDKQSMLGNIKTFRKEEREIFSNLKSDFLAREETTNYLVNNESDSDNNDSDGVPCLKEDGTECRINLPKFNVLGQIHKTFIIAEVENGFYIIDQHVAHERVLYEKFLSESKTGKIHTQELISPVQINLSAKDSIIVSDNLDIFVNLGFELQEFGENSFVIRKVPIIMGKSLGKEELVDLIDDIVKLFNEGKDKLDSIENKRDKIVTTMSCRAAIKAGKELTPKEVKDLVADLLKTENPFTCPHGRPVIINMSLYELEKLFKRVQ